jgi:hypothetical protein
MGDLLSISITRIGHSGPGHPSATHRAIIPQIWKCLHFVLVCVLVKSSGFGYYVSEVVAGTVPP